MNQLIVSFRLHEKGNRGDFFVSEEKAAIQSLRFLISNFFKMNFAERI